MLLNKIRHRLTNTINAGSMADIAFLLLIFFLVTTTIVMDKGIRVKLPPFDPNPPISLPPAKNVLSVKVNLHNQLLVEGTQTSIDQLKTLTKEFIMNPQKKEALPDKPTKAIISLQNDRATAYKTYLSVYNELKAAYNELWNEQALKNYGKTYEALNKVDQRQIRKEIPLVISEAEPTDLAN